MPQSSGIWIALAGLAILGSNLPAFAQTVEEKAQACSACHGENGVPVDKTIPVIWGQHQGYLYIELRDYKLGTRKDPQMTPVAQALERNDMMQLAEYFSKKTWPSLNQPRADPATATKATRANASVGCTACHLAEYQGTGATPRLRDQSVEYMNKTLTQFRTRERANNPGMSDIAIATAPDDLAALAAYIAGL
jgi:cytochrome c553